MGNADDSTPAYWFVFRPLAAAMLVLTLASSASAECAWVLWQQSIEVALPDPKPQERQVIAFSGHESKKECDDATEQQIVAGVEIGGQRLPTGVMITMLGSSGSRDSHLIVTYRCLPDTVDPRVPKPGAR